MSSRRVSKLTAAKLPDVCRASGSRGLAWSRLAKSPELADKAQELAQQGLCVIAERAGKPARIYWAGALDSPDEVENALRQRAAARGAEGIAFSDLRRLFPGWHRQGLLEPAVWRLLQAGDWVERRKGNRTRFYSFAWAPPEPQEMARKEIERRLADPALIDGSAVETTYLMRGVPTPLRATLRDLLEQAVATGRLERIRVRLSAKRQIEAVRLASHAPPTQSPSMPSWEDVAGAARRAGARHMDGAASFEEIASLLGVTPLAVKTVVLERLESGQGGLVLIPGEPNQVRDYAQARLEWRGQTFLRMALTHANPPR